MLPKESGALENGTSSEDMGVPTANRASRLRGLCGYPSPLTHAYLPTLRGSIRIQPNPSPHPGLQHPSLLSCLCHTILTPVYTQWNSRIANPHPMRNFANYSGHVFTFLFDFRCILEIPFFKVNWVPRPCVPSLQCHCYTIAQLGPSMRVCISTGTYPPSHGHLPGVWSEATQFSQA